MASLNFLVDRPIGSGMRTNVDARRQATWIGRWIAVGSAVLVTSAAAVMSVGGRGSANLADEQRHAVADTAGWSRLATTGKYIVIANVLPAEHMLTSDQATSQHPTEGELVLHGQGHAVGPDVRHVEAHIYDRSTGRPRADLHPSIVVLNRTTGERTVVPAVLMQDINIGEIDVHYGNNVRVAGNSDVLLTVAIDTEEVSFEGHLD